MQEDYDLNIYTIRFQLLILIVIRFLALKAVSPRGFLCSFSSNRIYLSLDLLSRQAAITTTSCGAARKESRSTLCGLILFQEKEGRKLLGLGYQKIKSRKDKHGDKRINPIFELRIAWLSLAWRLCDSVRRIGTVKLNRLMKQNFIWDIKRKKTKWNEFIKVSHILLFEWCPVSRSVSKVILFINNRRFNLRFFIPEYHS